MDWAKQEPPQRIQASLEDPLPDPNFTELQITSITRNGDSEVTQVVYTNGIKTMTVDITRNESGLVTDIASAVS